MRNTECPRNQWMSLLALERQENITERFADEGPLLERQDWFLTYKTDSLRDFLVCYIQEWQDEDQEDGWKMPAATNPEGLSLIHAVEREN